MKTLNREALIKEIIDIYLEGCEDFVSELKYVWKFGQKGLNEESDETLKEYYYNLVQNEEVYNERIAELTQEK